MAGNDWCISILALAFVDWRILFFVIQTRDCFLSGLHWYRVGIVLLTMGIYVSGNASIIANHSATYTDILIASQHYHQIKTRPQLCKRWIVLSTE